MQSAGILSNPVSLSNLGAASDVTGNRPGQSLEAVAKGLEETFLSILMKEMRQSLEPDGLFGHDSGDASGGMFDQFMAKHLTQGAGVGIGRVLKQQLEPVKSHAHERLSGRKPA